MTASILNRRNGRQHPVGLLRGEIAFAMVGRHGGEVVCLPFLSESVESKYAASRLQNFSPFIAGIVVDRPLRGRPLERRRFVPFVESIHQPDRTVGAAIVEIVAIASTTSWGRLWPPN